MPVITISRQFGAGGTTVGRLLADRLGLSLLDREIISRAATRLGHGEASVAGYDERTQRLIDRILFSLRMVASEAAPVDLTEAADERSIVAQTEEDVIREAAATGNVVIIGRGAHLILRDHPGIVRVRLVADPQVRLRRLIDEGRLTPAARMPDVINVDRERDRFVKERFGVASEDAMVYDLIVNTTSIPLADVPALIDAAAAAIMGARQA